MVENSYKAGVFVRSSFATVRAMMVAAGCLVAAQASAAEYLEKTSTSSSYSYLFTNAVNGDEQGSNGIGDVVGFIMKGPFSSTPSDLKLAYHSIVHAGGNFDFLHNLQCIGACEARIDTIVQSEITNLGSDPLSLKYDTLITPGFLGFNGLRAETTSAFDIRIFEGSDPSSPFSLYHMTGEINGLGVNEITGTGAPFTGLTYHENGRGKAYEWGATDLSFLLSPIAPGDTRVVTFITTTYVKTVGQCNALMSVCEAVQVAFGDPRNDGGGGEFGRNFSAFPSFIEVSEAPVPEMATWAMMISGFAMMGGALRRRPATRRVA